MNFDDMVPGGCIAYRLDPTVFRCDVLFSGERVYPFLFDQEDWGERSTEIYGWAKTNQWVHYAQRFQFETWKDLVPALFRGD